MSVVAEEDSNARGRTTKLPNGWSPPRLIATAGVAVVMLGFLSVLHFVSNVAGDPQAFLLLTVGALVAATVLARVLTPVRAFALASAIVVVGTYLYLQTLPEGLALVLARSDRVVRDTLSLLSGLSVLRIVNAGAWALAATPGPVFLSWYFTMRRRYVAAVVVAGATLSVFVLTGDAAAAVALLGTVGAAAAVGFGDIEHRGGTLAGGEAIAVVLAAMVVLTLSVSVVPASGGGGGIGGGWGGGGPSTVEASLIGADDRLRIRGSIELSPKVRFTVTSERAGYWRVAAYDRYTGRGWIRTGGERAYDGPLPSPPGDTRTVRQTFTMKATVNAMPALWRPKRVSSATVDVRVSPDGSIVPARPLEPGEDYIVESRVIAASPSELRNAGTDYPAYIEQRFLQVPASTPDRVRERTARITANADNPYDTARVVEQWLRNNRRYSLDVERPDGSIADAFLFEMEAGYCTYFATTMVVMLRTQGIPARFVVGYTPGQRVAEDKWVVRGYNSHAWVEVYFPGHGWIRFDPTPAAPREATTQTRLQQARANNVSGIDTNQTRDGEWTPTPITPTPITPTLGETTPTEGFQTVPRRGGRFGGPDSNGSVTPPGGADGGDGGFEPPELPSREQLALGAVVLAGAVAGLRRSGLAERGYRWVWLRHQPRTDPHTDVERAFERLEYLHARQDRPRAPGETPRQFLADARPQARRVGELYEHARYAGHVSEEDADEAVGIVDEIVKEWSRRI